MQRRALLGLETHGCRVNSSGWYGSHWRPIGQSPRHENFDYCATGGHCFLNVLNVNVGMDYYMRLLLPWAMTLSLRPKHTYCRERSSSPFRDHADRDLGSPVFLHMQCLLACRVKFIHIALFLSYVADCTENPYLVFPGLLGDT